jgi:arylsulfatase
MTRKDAPNFLVIMTEQQRGDCLGSDGHPVLLTPSMDEIGAQGTRFTRAYSMCPICVPARRSFLTGQAPATHGQLANTSNEFHAIPTLPGVLRDHGYQTCWLGRSAHQTPPRKRYGFDHMIINDHRLPLDDYDEFLAVHQPPNAGGYYGTGVMHNDFTARPWHMDEGLHHTNWTVGLALEFLRKRDPSCPFFCVVSFLASHPPLIPPACYFDRYMRMQLPEPAIGDWAVAPENKGLGLGAAAERVQLQGWRERMDRELAGRPAGQTA